jgi:hypothetical protein
MGTWGYHAFENDDAADWACSLDEEGFASIESALDAVLEKSGTLDLPESQSAVAAAETLCAVLGRPGPAVPGEVKIWAAQQKAPSSGLIAKAKRSLDHILSESELKEYWSETDNSDAWEAAVTDLTKRLG